MGVEGMINNNKTLILGWPVKPPQKWLQRYPDIEVARIYRENVNWCEKKFKDLSFHMPKSMQVCDCIKPSTWYGDWKERIKGFDTVILIDEIRGRDVFEYILEKNPQCNLNVFIDSPIKEGSKKEPFLYKDLPVRFFTCDRRIAERYHIEFAPYFYIFSPYDFGEYLNNCWLENNNDVFFVGEEKGDRAQRIAQIKEILAKAGLTHDIHLVPQNRRGKKKAAYMTYGDVIEHVKQSKAILELISDGQTGITQRPYEALFFKKKLITTSSEIKNYDFYCEQNVFVLGEREVAELPEFLNAPFKEIDKEIVDEYTLKSWVERFKK